MTDHDKTEQAERDACQKWFTSELYDANIGVVENGIMWQAALAAWNRRAALSAPQPAEPVACKHPNITPRMDWLTCDDCYSILTGGDFGVASRKWFRNLDEARFYQKHGRLPDPAPSPAQPADTGHEELCDMLADYRVQLDMIREALGVSPEPHQTLTERTLEAARRPAYTDTARDAYNRGLQAAIAIVEGGHHLHDQAPSAVWARQVTAKIRALIAATPSPSEPK